MNKRSRVFLLFIICSFKLFSLSFDEIKDIEKYTRLYVQMEDFFTPDTSEVCIEKPYDEHMNELFFYANPDFNSEILKSFNGKEFLTGKVVESKKMEGINKIINLYNPYHEMDIRQFCDKMDSLAEKN